MADESRPCPTNDYRPALNGSDTARLRTSVYQISKYPSNETRIEKAFRSQSDGANSSNTLGKGSRQPDLECAIDIGANLTTFAASVSSSALVGSLPAPGSGCKSNARIGSNCGSLSTSSSESNRNLPGSTSKSQTCIGCVPRIHGARSARLFGMTMRFEGSAVVCARRRSGAMAFQLNPPDFTVFLNSLTPYFSSKHIFCLLTSPQFYRTFVLTLLLAVELGKAARYRTAIPVWRI
jgi:hypothetical protein